MYLDIIVSLLLTACVLAMTFAVVNGVIAAFRFRIRRGKALSDYEADLIRHAARRDSYEELARFASEYFDDPYFSSRIRQLWYTKEKCPECNGKGKKWQNSKSKCEHCWGTGKHLKDR